MYPPSLIEETVVRLLRDSECRLPPDVHAALRQALENERQEMPRSQLMAILSNVDRAAERSVPMCQDTGLPVFFVRGRCDHRILESIRKGVARATRRYRSARTPWTPSQGRTSARTW